MATKKVLEEKTKKEQTSKERIVEVIQFFTDVVNQKKAGAIISVKVGKNGRLSALTIDCCNFSTSHMEQVITSLLLANHDQENFSKKK